MGLEEEDYRSIFLALTGIGQQMLEKDEQEPVMGIEPMTPVLPRLCATAAPHGQAKGGQ